MRFMSFIAVACITLSTAGAAQAGQYADAMAKCVTSSTTAQDRTVMIHWIFSALAAAPDVRSMTTITEAQRDQIARRAASLIERLITEDCREQSIDALYYEGVAAFQSSFEAFGKTAGEQIFDAPEAEKEMERMTKFMDSAKFEALSKDLSRSKR